MKKNNMSHPEFSGMAKNYTCNAVMYDTWWAKVNAYSSGSFFIRS